MTVTAKHILVPTLAVHRAWEWKRFHLHRLIFLCIAKAPTVEPTALLIRKGLYVIDRLRTNVRIPEEELQN